MSKVQIISVITFLSYSVIIGALVFSRGFLLNRQTLLDKAGPCVEQKHQTIYHPEGIVEEGGTEILNLTDAADWCNQSPPLFKKAVLILVDALRYDFVGRMEFLSEILAEKKPARGGNVEGSSCLFKFVADPPTTTMQRLKALMTGTMPTFIDASANFNSYQVEEDSLIYQLFTAGRRLAFLGDDTWLSLFPRKLFTSSWVHAFPSFNAWDLDTVDSAVNTTLREMFTSTESPPWDVLITHLLGVDHCGHRYGPSHPEMVRKLREADEILRFVYSQMDASTLLVVFGDHGMTSTGDHGGDSKEETDSAVIFLTKGSNYIPFSFQCPSEPPPVSQIDLVPTLATFLGVPVPFSNIGGLLPNILPFNYRHLYTDGLAANAAQVHRYTTKFGLSSNPDLSKDYIQLEESFRDYQLSRNSSHRARLNALAARYLSNVKSIARQTWTRFNLPMITVGIVISSLSLVGLSIYLISLPVLVSSKYSAMAWLWPSLPVWSVLWTATSSAPMSSNLISIIISTLGGLSMFLLCLSAHLLKNPVKVQGSIQDGVSFLLYGVTCFGVFSNSFVINEGAILGNTLLLIIFLHVVFKRGSISGGGGYMGSILQRRRLECSLCCFVMVAVLVRTCSIFFRCREELETCSEEYLLHKNLNSLPEQWLVHKYVRYSIALLSLAIFVVAFRLWMLYQKCLFSTSPAALIAKFIPSLLVVILGVFWALQGLPLINPAKVKPILTYFPWVFQLTTGCSLIIVWIFPHFVSPHSCTSIKKSSKSLQNGSVFLDMDVNHPEGSDTYSPPILLFTTLLIILLSQTMSVGIAPAVAIITPYLLVSLVGIFREDDSWTPVIVWSLLSQYMFYGTGHQPIFSAIPWDTAFQSDGQAFTDAADSFLTWLRPGLAIMGNLHVSQIVFSVALPLLAYWSPGEEQKTSGCRGRRQKAYRLSGRFIFLHGLKLLGCMACAGVHRRHLMVWKIFAPKFIFELVSYLVTLVATLLSLCFVTRIDFLHHKHHPRNAYPKIINK